MTDYVEFFLKKKFIYLMDGENKRSKLSARCRYEREKL